MSDVYSGEKTSSNPGAQLVIEAMTPSSELALTGQYPPSTFTTFKALQQTVRAKVESLDKNGKDQYISLKSVSQKEFDLIDAKRGQLGATVRFTYFPDIQVLIIKVPTQEQERCHRSLGEDIVCKLDRMGVDRKREFQTEGATLYTGPTQSNKEADSSWSNPTLQPQSAWPCFVIEAGVSESMLRLRAEAAWWFSNSNGQVRLVLLIQVDRQSRVMTIEKYDRFQARLTRTNPGGLETTPAPNNRP